MDSLQPPSTQFHIRPVQLSDAKTLQFTCWKDRPLATIHNLINRTQHNSRRERGLGIVATDPQDKMSIAFAQLTVWTGCGEISDLIVASAYRNRGIGTAVIQHLIRHAQDLQLKCVEIGGADSNQNALRLYRRLGFRDSYTLNLDLGSGDEPVIYLRVDL